MNFKSSDFNAVLLLEDGKTFYGKSFGAKGESFGEVVFNTSMTGYQEILTDPSYCGQMVTMTYPLIGNYGVNDEDVESNKIQAFGLIVKELAKLHSNYRSTKSLPQYLEENKVIGIEGIDTRELTRHLRSAGAMKGVISTIDLDPDSLLKKVKSSPSLVGTDLVKEVTCKEAYNWSEKGDFKVAVIDCGVKFNILRLLESHSCQLRVFPATVSKEEIERFNPDGVFFSNGPGDPGAVTYVIELARELLKNKELPLFGICLGHQMLGLAYDAEYSKLKFGHRGGNQPVKNLGNGTVEITSQNHGFAVDLKSLPSCLEATHIHLNDNTLSGMRHKSQPVFSVQYHPESSPGPHDSRYLFQEFIDNIKTYKAV